MFSISFGSLLAFALAAERGDAIDKLVIFGGYADFHATMRFCLTGEVASGRKALRDPLNQPVVLLNLIDLLDHERAERDQLLAAWRLYVERTWGRPEMKADRAFVAVAAAWRRFVERTWGRPELKLEERYLAVARDLLPEVPEAVRDLYLVGVGVLPGARELVFDALDRFDASALDPAPYLPKITNRVDLVHGIDDDVIPYEHSQRLAAALVNADVRVHITGVYGHTGSQRPPLSTAAREMLTMLRVLRALA